GGARVGEDDRDRIAVNAHALLEIVVVDLSVRLRTYHDVSAVLQPQDFRDAVVSVFGKIDDPLGVELPREVEPVHVALGPAVGHITPEGPVAPFNFPLTKSRQAGKVGKDLALEGVGVEPVVAARKS